jgi:ribosomal protein L11 methyltransferase
MSCHALTVEVEREAADDVAALLVEAGARGAEVQDGSILAMPGVPAIAPGRARVVAFFDDPGAAAAAARELGLAPVCVAAVPGRDWGEEWKRGLAPLRVGRVFVRPSWIAAAPPPGMVEVVLDPGMAFGTGTHPTTSLCLRALDELLRECPSAEVLDVGTGSGLLAIAARKLGARRVAATENDPVALEVAAENARRNGVELELLLAPPDAVSGAFPIVVANILANTLVELAASLAGRLAAPGTLLLSGILAGQEEEVRRAYLRCGLAPRPALDACEGEWRLLALERHA